MLLCVTSRYQPAADDPRIVQMLSTEHWSILSARSLAYNEGFARAGMFLSFLAMSMVALGLLAQGTGFSREFATIAAAILDFDLLIGLTTYLRIAGANFDDLLAMHAMSCIRHAYTQIAPPLRPYFTAPVNDDIESVQQAYGSAWGRTALGALTYVLSTTLGMVLLIVSAIGGVLAGVIASLVTAPPGASVLVGVAGAALVFVLLAVSTYRVVTAARARLPTMFPAESDAA